MPGTKRDIVAHANTQSFDRSPSCSIAILVQKSTNAAHIYKHLKINMHEDFIFSLTGCSMVTLYQISSNFSFIGQNAWPQGNEAVLQYIVITKTSNAKT